MTLSTQITKTIYSLKGYAIILTRDTENAQDLIQDTLIKALQNTDKFEAGTNLKAWCYILMKNTFINDYRRLKRSPVTTYDMVPEYSTHTTNDGFEQVKLETIMAEFGKLPKELSLAFLMHFQGFKYREIAEQLQLPEGTVKSQIYRAKQVMQGRVSR